MSHFYQILKTHLIAMWFLHFLYCRSSFVEVSSVPAQTITCCWEQVTPIQNLLYVVSKHCSHLLWINTVLLLPSTFPIKPHTEHMQFSNTWIVWIQLLIQLFSIFNISYTHTYTPHKSHTHVTHTTYTPLIHITNTYHTRPHSPHTDTLHRASDSHHAHMWLCRFENPHRAQSSLLP